MTPLFIDKNFMSRRLVNKGNKTFAILLNGLPMTTVLCFYVFFLKLGTARPTVLNPYRTFSILLNGLPLTGTCDVIGGGTPTGAVCCVPPNPRSYPLILATGVTSQPEVSIGLEPPKEAETPTLPVVTSLPLLGLGARTTNMFYKTQ